MSALNFIAESPDLTGMTKTQLLEYAGGLGLNLSSSLKKGDIIAAIIGAE